MMQILDLELDSWLSMLKMMCYSDLQNITKFGFDPIKFEYVTVT